MERRKKKEEDEKEEEQAKTQVDDNNGPRENDIGDKGKLRKCVYRIWMAPCF